MIAWENRPFEIRNLFNPAFCGLLLLRSFKGYEEVDKTGMPFSLSLLVLPLCLHKTTRELFSSNSKRYLLKMISENPEILVDFAERTNKLIPYTFEGLGLAMYKGSFKVSESGCFQMNKRGVKSKINGSEESQTCQRVARNLGRKFAQINDPVTIYTTLGIKP